MKPKLIIGIIAIVGFTSLLMYNFGNSISTYVNFEQAADMNSAHVVGTWDDSRDYGFSMESKQFTFYMKDEAGNVRRVVYPKSKPNNFEQADRLVVIGKIEGEVFYADEMLMKCPSKYNNADGAQFEKANVGNS
ncbi:cytochrome c maturation protein CcmE domain-containing protein [Fodinibius sediminis]|uniref:Cytochrome c-type biogenesis protein CcmE n=1 Tax=Fodinibius sediminis TaxID=1214077 RepID=A0A521EPF8_9BACT|nr:cytochrome c maturation protein CcmE [Fodinibius sediminis]SMO85331.1 cytochrome c-type biogenesis protein CcmE [Fodinibius sediminis]